MCAPTVAASVLSVENTTFSVTVRPYTGIKHLPQCTRIHPGSRSLPLVLVLAAEIGATGVVRGVLGARGVVIASMSSEG